ncbi:MAG TPA: HAD family hydrolase [Candidatus Saccharimonadales bacterium]|nr:HAD family hydrolase [Candidatus Saccharimonadales bacterium]
MTRATSGWGVVFDMDDTLLLTSPTFHAAMLRLCLRLAELGIPMDETRERLDRVDLGRIEEAGYGKARWPESMGLTYRSFAEEGRLPYDPQVERECVQIGWSTYEAHPPVRAGAREVLETLRPRVLLALATMGDEDLQRARLEHSGLERHFDRVFIVRHKTPGEFRRILDACGLAPERAFMVGDGMRSDINPALEVGMHAIHVRGQSWAHQQVPPLHGDFHAVDDLEDIPPLVFERMGPPPG